MRRELDVPLKRKIGCSDTAVVAFAEGLLLLVTPCVASHAPATAIHRHRRNYDERAHPTRDGVAPCS
jgi:microsomal dipeptidase-like Zn-dependent dipeptidase